MRLPPSAEGRVRIDDAIDPAVGFMAECRIGDQLNAGATLGTVYCRDETSANEASQRIRAAYEISDHSPTEIPHLLRT